MTKDSAERQSVETDGQSIDDAIERALRQLGVTRDRVDIEILSHTSRGLFGLGRRRATIRATLRRPLALASSATTSAGHPGRAGNRAENPAFERTAAGAETNALNSRVEPAGNAAESISGAALSRACSVLAEIVRLTGSEASVEVAHDPTGVRLVIAGDSGGILIGRRGQTLDALEYLLNRIMAHADASSPPLTVDLQGYRLRRQQTLEALAQRAASRARASGRPVALNPMSPRDRRIVHMALREAAALTTRSAGTGFYRRVIVAPSGNRRGRPRPPQPS
jgi:spoIIIJ-associated protein